MEKIINNSGLQHLAENIFLNLNYEALQECSNVNSSCKEILENPLFWLKLFIRRGLSKKNQKDWICAIQLVKNTDLEKNISSYLKRSSKNQRVVDIPCYINEDTIRKFRKMSHLNENNFQNIGYWKEIPYGCIQILTPIISKDQGAKLMRNVTCTLYNYSIEYLDGPTSELVKVSTLELVKVLVPLMDDPNAPTNNYFNSPKVTSPIHWAAIFGHTELVKILAPLTENPNAPADPTDGISPIFSAAMRGYTEIVKTLIPLTENPNVPSKGWGKTPFEIATENGHTEIAKILEPFK